MLTTPDTPLDCLKIPDNQKLLSPKPRRTISFTEQPGQVDERIASNLSLSSLKPSILKKPNSTVSSQLNVYYTPMDNDNKEKIPFHSSSTSIENNLHKTTHKDQEHLFENLLSTKSKEPGWSFLFSHAHRRSNDENSDAYKIFSILYGLVIFIGGVAFSISHAIIPTEEAEHIKHLAEVYFTYLYWVSIFWIIFCMFDIVHHRRKLAINASTIDKLDMHLIPKPPTDLRLARTKKMSTMSDEEMPKAPYFNLQLFDDSDEFQSEIHDDTNHNQRHATNSITPVHDDDDDDDNDGVHGALSFTRHKSQSLDNLSTRSSVSMRKHTDTTRDVLSRRLALDPGAAHHLRNYVRHRKDSIVQRVIGYNYDDHSTAGGLYIRVGIGIFCLGTVIHSGLSILSNLENLPCARWTAVMDDFSRLLFSFIQFFFIFKHSNLIIRAHESLARLAVMHIVVTNLCVWFRMVVIETKSQIVEMAAHEGGGAHIASSTHPINSSHVLINPLNHAPSNPSSCIQSVEDALQMTAFINEGYMRLKPLLYPCTIEFSLMCLTLFFLIWENIGKTFAYKMSDKAGTKNVFMVNCHASIKGLFAGMIIFSCTVISIILYAVFRNKIGEDLHASSLANYHENFPVNRIHSRAITHTATSSYYRHLVTTSSTTIATTLAYGPFRSISKTPKKILYSIAIVEIVNFCLLSASLLATTWALIKIRKLQYKRITTRFDDVLIVVSLTGTYLYSIFSAFALLNNKNQSTWIAYLKIVIVVLEFVEATVHAFFILVALRKRLNRTSKHQYPAREIITLLIMIDLSLWFEETTTTTKHEANPFQLAFYHIIPWSIIAAIATPLQIFFRFHASVCLSHVWENMYILPAYEKVAPHGL
ncbi:unnamed protein product [Adineta steineri]|uniref:Otopetrin n=1 Tax=Adineta steineri TaxID=433720 RepID=A0A819IG79_9BILA|nr:unnamed protein product [Adineta steineri]CAF3915841.1 unnamed protein product [Adineta steineri]